MIDTSFRATARSVFPVHAMRLLTHTVNFVLLPLFLIHVYIWFVLGSKSNCVIIGHDF